jgi:hypothetical protein
MRYIFLLIIISFIIGSCRKDDVFTSAPVSLNFSTDTVDFDTIFSLKDTNLLNTPKSITLRLIVTNPNENAVKTTIELEGNLLSVFKINADGIPGSGSLQKIENLEIRGKDSVYIFIQSYIKPDLVDEFSVAEKLLFSTNGKQQSVVLLTYALNANFLKEKIFTTSTTWSGTKPYVIYDDILVEKGVILTINPGVKIYSHNNSTIYVAGTIKIEGTVDKPVVLQGDRLDDAYKEVPNQWNGIHLLSTSINNKITGAIIKNGFIGIRVDSLASNANPKLELTQTKIFDMGAVGLLSYSAYIKAENNLISDCGQYTFLGDLGGNYEFTFNTFAALGSSSARKNATFTLTNSPYRNENGTIIKVFPLSYNLRNNIIWGSNEDEINFVRDPDGITNATNVKNNNIKSVVFRDELIQTIPSIANNQVNFDPLFIDANKKNYKLKGGSPCTGAGDSTTGITDDLEYNKSKKSPPAIGCYELD